MLIHRQTKSLVDEHIPLDTAALHGLSDFRYLVYSKELCLYIQARWPGIYDSLIPTRIQRLMLSSLDKYEAEGLGETQTTLCPALTAVRGETIITLIARSDWPLESRLLAATTGRLRHLKITARTCDLLLDEKGRFKDLAPLFKLASTLARGLPGATVKYGQYDLRAWRDIARKLISGNSAEDERIRIRWAKSLLTVPHFDQICGVRRS